MRIAPLCLLVLALSGCSPAGLMLAGTVGGIVLHATGATDNLVNAYEALKAKKPLACTVHDPR